MATQVAANVQKVLDDYRAVEKDNQIYTVGAQRSEIKKFFDSTYDPSDSPLANPVGRYSLTKLADFMCSTLFPLDGSWIQYKPSEKYNAQQETMAIAAREKLNESLLKTNFYLEINKSVRNALLFNRAKIETTYTNGLSFRCVDDENLLVSENIDENNKRAYSEIEYTLLDLINTFDDVPDHLHDRLRKAGETTARITVLNCLLPSNGNYFDVPSKYKYTNVYILKEEQVEIKKKEEGIKGSNTFPIMIYRTRSHSSLAQEAMPLAVIIEHYEQLHLQQAELSMNSPIAIDADTIRTNNFNLRAGGIVPIANHLTREPSPIRVTQDYKPNDAIIQKKQLELQQLFMIDMIQQSQVTNVQSFEYHQNMVKLLQAIQPLVLDLTTRATHSLLNRVHSLLKDNDAEYGAITREFDGYLYASGIGLQMAKSQKMANMARFAQTATPFIQAKPAAAQKLNEDITMSCIAIAAGVPEILRPQEEVDKERQAQAEQAQAQQQAEVQNQQAGAANQMAGAQAQLNQGGQ